MVEILNKLKRGIGGIKSRFSKKPDFDLGMIKNRVNAPMTKPKLEPLRPPPTGPSADLEPRFLNEPPEATMNRRFPATPPPLPPPIHRPDSRRPEPTPVAKPSPIRPAPSPDFYAEQEDISLIRKELSSISARLDTIDQRLRIIEDRMRR
ncbi:MAG: hypothetical protein DRO96_01270 [Candidatus Aenigmatarchaeota archaeon]|nr:MAG: hypothetical protein DRH15_12605 [Deltaproteobacteria bacterium]RLI97196.1 MAG: hypothetical protein DRO96_01270 [Candidatus Aenigmarchaeota archaeon]